MKRKEWRKLTGVRRFTPDEFPEDPEEHAEPGLIYSLDNFAVALGKAVYPSPAPGALARTDGSKRSRHYAVGRLSDGCDLFCNCSIFQAWATALQLGEFNGIGVYFDTHFRGVPWPMIHLDKRPSSLRCIWFRDGDGQYHYAGTHSNFWQDLAKRLARPVTMKG